MSRKNKGEGSQIPWFDSPEKALSFAFDNKEKECFIVGGAEIYNLFANNANRIYLSTVDFEGEADAYFPDFDTKNYQIIEKRDYCETEKSPAWKFELFERVVN